jgi:BioD-like phosphotransacetylase family protein
MARKNFLIAVMVVSSLLLSSIVQAQSDADGQTRRVKGHILTSTSLPPIRIRFDKRFKYVGSQQFVLYDRAQVEQYFFVDADRQQHIKRMYMVQFEGYLPNISGSYNYPVTKTVSLAGQSYIADAEIVQSVAAAIKQDTKSDVARAASFLESKGYQVGEGIAFQRFVRLVDEARSREFILLYVEDLSRADLDAVEKEKAMKEFSGRALKGFKILE